MQAAALTEWIWCDQPDSQKPLRTKKLRSKNSNKLSLKIRRLHELAETNSISVKHWGLIQHVEIFVY